MSQVIKKTNQLVELQQQQQQQPLALPGAVEGSPSYGAQGCTCSEGLQPCSRTQQQGRMHTRRLVQHHHLEELMLLKALTKVPFDA